MTGPARHGKPETDDRKVIFLELVAAGAILCVVVLMLYLVLTFPTT
jgi:hypothetical protein